MHLPTVMRLVVEEVKHGDGRDLHIIFAQAVDVAKLPVQKVRIGTGEEGFNFLVLCDANRIEFSGGVVLPPPANLDVQMRSPSSI
jgi:hypothetical protein